jgi:hypothetical protein
MGINKAVIDFCLQHHVGGKERMLELAPCGLRIEDKQQQYKREKEGNHRDAVVVFFWMQCHRGIFSSVQMYQDLVIRERIPGGMPGAVPD